MINTTTADTTTIDEINVSLDMQQNWQEILDLLAELCQIPAALIMRLQQPDIEVFLSSQSTGNPYAPGDKDHFQDSGLYCERVIKTQNPLLVPDALADAKWQNNPDIERNMIAYLGFPIRLPDGKPFGTICILDNKHNPFSPTIEKLMSKCQTMIEYNLTMLYMNQVLGDENRRLTDYVREIQTLRGMVSICANCKAIKDSNGEWQPIEHYLIKHPEARFSHGICPACIRKLYPDA